MTREEQIRKKAKELGQQYFPDSSNIWARSNVEACYVENACVEMAEWLDQHPHWIPVEEELPEKDNEFEDYSKLVVVTDGKDFYKGMYNYGGGCWLTHDLWPIEDATYWMEVQLPQPPRKEE